MRFRVPESVINIDRFQKNNEFGGRIKSEHTIRPADFSFGLPAKQSSSE
jgi:hypothetical protein